MLKAYIKLHNLDDIKKLHETAKSCDYDLIIESGVCRINPKSIMGVLGIGINKTVALVAKNNNKKEFLDKFGCFLSV